MASKKAKLDDLSKIVSKELTLYGEDVIKGIKAKNTEVTKQFVADTRADAPRSKTRRSGTFAKNITYKKTKETDKVLINTWYVKDPEYRLTHLLKNGHQTKGGGRTKPQDFITNNYNRAMDEFEKGIEEVIQNGH